MTIREMRTRLGETQSEFATRYHIPFRTIQNWETGLRKPPEYIVSLLETRIRADLINRRTTVLPKYSPQKSNLPKRSDYIGALGWLNAVRECIGEPVVFALDEALMCQGLFGGRNDEFVVWIYGEDSVTRFNGVVLLGNRTLADAFANESILDMQGITEAVSKHYYRNGESFGGISVVPEYQERFERLANEAIEYYGD